MANLMPWPIKESDDNGTPLAGGIVYGYESGTNNPKDFLNPAGTSIGAAVTLDAGGRGIICLDAGRYKVILKDSLGNQIWLVDPMSIGGATGSISVVDSMGYVDAQHPTAMTSNLKALTEGAYDQVVVRGYWAVGDGGGGSFHWAAADTTTDDYGIHVIPTVSTGAGRWVRDSVTVSDIRYFGAVGDAITDNASYIGYAAAYAAAIEINSVVSPQSILVPWGKFLIGSDPGVGSIRTELQPGGMLVWTAAINPPVKPVIDPNDDSQHFDCTAANAPVVAGVVMLRPEWFGAVGDGTADDTDPVNACLASAVETAFSQPGVSIEMNPGATYGVSGTTGLVLDSRSGLVINGNNASIKCLSGAGPMVSFKGCSNLVVNKLLLKGQATSLYGFYFEKNSGGTGNSSITINDCYVENCLTSAVCLGIGDHNDTGAVTDCSFNRLQTVNNTIHIHAYDDYIRGVRFNDWHASGTGEYFVKAEFGVLDFINPDIRPETGVADGYWIWSVQDGAVRVEGGDTQTTLGYGLILMLAQTTTPLQTMQPLHCGSSFVNHKMYSAGTTSYTGYDDGTIIAMLSGSRCLRVSNSDLDIPTTGYTGYPIALISGCGTFISSNNRWAVGAGGQPWYGGYSAGNPVPPGEYVSTNDVFYTWTDTGAGWYERTTYVQPIAQCQSDQNYSLDIIMPDTTSGAYQKYLRWGRIGAGNSGIYRELGTIGWSSTATSGAASTFHVNNLESTAFTIDQNLRAVHYGRVSLIKGADVATGGVSMIGPSEGNFFHITGSGAFSSILSTGWQSGAIIHMYFEEALTVSTNDITMGVLLQGGGNYVVEPGEIMSFVLDVDRWRQISSYRRILGSLGTGTIVAATSVLTLGAGGNSYNVNGTGAVVSHITYTGWPSGSVIHLISTVYEVYYYHDMGSVPSNTYKLKLTGGTPGSYTSVAVGDCISFINTGTVWSQL